MHLFAKGVADTPELNAVSHTFGHIVKYETADNYSRCMPRKIIYQISIMPNTAPHAGGPDAAQKPNNSIPVDQSITAIV